jgi:hypothetical protein
MQISSPNDSNIVRPYQPLRVPLGPGHASAKNHRLDRVQPSRFERGTAARLRKLKSMWQEYRYEFDVRIVQPGLSRSAIGAEGLHLLAGAETYLLETRAMPLRIIASA